MSPKMKIVGFGLRDTLKNPEIIEMKGVMVSPTSKSQSYRTKMDQNNSLEHFGILSLYIYHQNGFNMAEHFPIFSYDVFMMSYSFRTTSY